MNWKKVVSVSLAGAVTGGLLALVHVLPLPLQPVVSPVVGGAAAAVAHWLNMWGSK